MEKVLIMDDPNRYKGLKMSEVIQRCIDEKWRNIRDNSATCNGSSDCLLCIVYYQKPPKYTTLPSPPFGGLRGCRLCPLYMYGNGCVSEGDRHSIYEEYEVHMEDEPMLSFSDGSEYHEEWEKWDNERFKISDKMVQELKRIKEICVKMEKPLG